MMKCVDAGRSVAENEGDGVAGESSDSRLRGNDGRGRVGAGSPRESVGQAPPYTCDQDTQRFKP